jgi:hypothetical protein
MTKIRRRTVKGKSKRIPSGKVQKIKKPLPSQNDVESGISPIITKIDDARHLKRAGLPLNLPVTHREFSRKYTEHWLGLMNAHDHFMNAVHQYSDDIHAGSAVQWRLVKRRLDGMFKGMRQCEAFMHKLGGRVMPRLFKSEQDVHEYLILSAFLAERARPFTEYWQRAIDAVDNGTPLTIRMGDIQKWVDLET